MSKREKPEPTVPKVEKPSKPFTPTVTVEQLASLIKELPEARITVEDRWYGETFYPKYAQTLQKLKELIK